MEAKANLLRLRQDIPLLDAELSAVEDGLAAYEKLLAKLADVPTPAGLHRGNYTVGRSFRSDFLKEWPKKTQK